MASYLDSDKIYIPYGGEGELADRPDASDVSTGSVYYATDDNGGRAWISNGSTWQGFAPSNAAVGGTLLALAQPSSIASVACATAGTDYRIPELTISFTMPDRPVKINMTDLRAYIFGTDTAPVLTMYYTTNNWSSKTVLLAQDIPYASDSLFYIRSFVPKEVFLPTSISVGATVGVAVFIADTTTNSRTFTIAANHSGDRSTMLRPSITATAMGS